MLIDELLSADDSSQYSAPYSNPVDSALRELARRNEELIEQNARLRLDVNDVEERWTAEREELESELSQKDKDNAKLRKKVGVLQETNEILETRVRVAEIQSNQHAEQLEIESESWGLKLGQLSEQAENSSQIQSRNRQLRSQVKACKREMKTQQETIKNLQAGLKFIKENCDTEVSNLQKSEMRSNTTLRTKLAEAKQRITGLTAQNQSLKKLIEDQRDQVQRMSTSKSITRKRSVGTTPKKGPKVPATQNERFPSPTRGLRSSPARGSRTQTPRGSRTQTPRGQRMSTPNGQRVKIQLSDAKRSGQRSALTARSRLSEDLSEAFASQRPPSILKKTMEAGGSYTEQIRRLNRDITEMNKRYKQLLQESQDPCCDMHTIRSELVRIAKALERSSEQLYNIKKLQSLDIDDS